MQRFSPFKAEKIMNLVYTGHGRPYSKSIQGGQGVELYSRGGRTLIFKKPEKAKRRGDNTKQGRIRLDTVRQGPGQVETKQLKIEAKCRKGRKSDSTCDKKELFGKRREEYKIGKSDHKVKR
jgi:hypothetical protein